MKLPKQFDFHVEFEVKTFEDFGLDGFGQSVVIGGSGRSGVDNKIGVNGGDLSATKRFTFPI